MEISNKRFLTDLSNYNHDIQKIQDCANSPAPSMLQIKNDKGIQLALDFITLQLIRLNELLNLSRSMNNAQIEFVSNQILKDYPLNQLKSTDIKFVFDEILSGKHGKMYGSIDPPFIISCLRNHFNNRSEFSGMQSASLSIQHKQ